MLGGCSESVNQALSEVRGVVASPRMRCGPIWWLAAGSELVVDVSPDPARRADIPGVSGFVGSREVRSAA